MPKIPTERERLTMTRTGAALDKPDNERPQEHHGEQPFADAEGDCRSVS
jgi:hypothetical protein